MDTNEKYFFESLYKKREKDEWYERLCRQTFSQLTDLEEVLKKYESVTIHDMGTHVYLRITLVSFEEKDFSFKEHLDLEISKIAPYYKYYTLHEAKHVNFDFEITGISNSETPKMIQLIAEIDEVLGNITYKHLREEKLHQTVFSWDELDIQKLETFGAERLTLDYALFFDVLKLL